MWINKKLNFIGNVEGRDLFDGKADVIITEGFTGNVIFKMGESFYDYAASKGAIFVYTGLLAVSLSIKGIKLTP